MQRTQTHRFESRPTNQMCKVIAECPGTHTNATFIDHTTRPLTTSHEYCQGTTPQVICACLILALRPIWDLNPGKERPVFGAVVRIDASDQMNVPILILWSLRRAAATPIASLQLLSLHFLPLRALWAKQLPERFDKYWPHRTNIGHITRTLTTSHEQWPHRTNIDDIARPLTTSHEY